MSGHAFPIVFFIGFVLIAVAAIVYQLWSRAQREKRLRAWAEANGWSYELENANLEHAWRGISPFGTGSRRLCRHVIRGVHGGHNFTLCQYQYTVKSNKSSHTYHHQIMRLDMPLSVPLLTIQPEHFGHKIFDALGGEDIDFESDEFSKKFWVKCDDRKFAYDVITPDMMEFLMGQPKDFWQWHGDVLQIHDLGLLEPAAGQALLDRVTGFADRLPRHRLATD